MQRTAPVYGEISGVLGAFAPADGNWAQNKISPAFWFFFLEAITGFERWGVGRNFYPVAFYSPSFPIPAASLGFIEHLCGAHYRRICSFGLF